MAAGLAGNDGDEVPSRARWDRIRRSRFHIPLTIQASFWFSLLSDDILAVF